jgi:hypothetical protein
MEQLRDVSNILWRERRLLELLAFKLDSERLLARAGRTRWLARADHEVETVLGALKAVELERAVLVQSLLPELALAGDATLEALADSVPAEWTGIFADHRRAMLDLARDVDRSARRSRRQPVHAPKIVLAATNEDHGVTAVSRAIAEIVTPPTEQTPADMRAASRGSVRGSTDRQRASERTETVVARLPSLVDFLR